MITNKRTVTRLDGNYMILFATPVRPDGHVAIRNPFTSHRYQMPGQHWNALLNQQRAQYHGIARMFAIDPADPELSPI